MKNGFGDALKTLTDGTVAIWSWFRGERSRCGTCVVEIDKGFVGSIVARKWLVRLCSNARRTSGDWLLVKAANTSCWCRSTIEGHRGACHSIALESAMLCNRFRLISGDAVLGDFDGLPDRVCC